MSVWGQPTSHRYKVKFNKLGKPVGKNKSRFTEFLGTISRNGSYAPIDVQDWRKIDNSRKKDMLKIVKVIKLKSFYTCINICSLFMI